MNVPTMSKSGRGCVAKRREREKNDIEKEGIFVAETGRDIRGTLKGSRGPKNKRVTQRSHQIKPYIRVSAINGQNCHLWPSNHQVISDNNAQMGYPLKEL